MIDAAEPVKDDAQSLAKSDIRNMTEKWSRMRVGFSRGVVYVAPKSRSKGPRNMRRRNLFELIAGRSLEPALDRNVDEVELRVGEVLLKAGRVWEI